MFAVFLVFRVHEFFKLPYYELLFVVLQAYIIGHLHENFHSRFQAIAPTFKVNNKLPNLFLLCFSY